MIAGMRTVSIRVAGQAGCGIRSIPSWVTLSGTLVAAFLAPASHASAQPIAVQGSYHRLWVDARDRSAAGRILHFVTTPDGRTRELLLDATLEGELFRLPASGAELQLTGDSLPAFGGRPARLRVRGATVPMGAERESPMPLALDRRLAAAGRRMPYLTVLCKFADSTTVEPRTAAAYDRILTGTSYPGQHHFWREITGGHIDLSGSRVVGWYTMARSMTAYFGRKQDGTPNITGSAANWDLLQKDCLDAADADVDYNAFVGFNLQFNTNWDVAVGGGWWLVRDGTSRAVGMTWMTAWVTPATYAHEIGHSLGLPHSSTPYEQQYGSAWDVMSSGLVHDGSVPDWVPTGTIAFHQHLLGVPLSIPLSLPALGTRQTVTVERTNGDRAPQSFVIPSSDGTFYTVEARRKQGSYDKWLPLDGVLVHHVDVRSPVAVPARILDADGNGNPNDAGAAWTPGESYADSVNGFGFTVTAPTENGYELSVRRGWQLTVTIRGPGSVAGDLACSPAAAPCELLAASRGLSRNITAVPDSGAQFVGWSGDCIGSENSCTVRLSQDRTAEARFIVPIHILTAALRAGRVGLTYLDTLRASGGDTTLIWSIASGALPAGMGLNPTTGVIGGSPQEAGDFTLTVRASAGSLEAMQVVSVQIAHPVLSLGTVIAHLTGRTPLSPTLVKYLDKLGNDNNRVDVGDLAAWRRLTTPSTSQSTEEVVP